MNMKSRARLKFASGASNLFNQQHHILDHLSDLKKEIVDMLKYDHNIIGLPTPAAQLHQNEGSQSEL